MPKYEGYEYRGEEVHLHLVQADSLEAAKAYLERAVPGITNIRELDLTDKDTGRARRKDG